MKNRLKEIREAHGMSQTELAERAGISRAVISKIENNEEANINTKTIAKIASVFSTQPSDIFLL